MYTKWEKYSKVTERRMACRSIICNLIAFEMPSALLRILETTICLDLAQIYTLHVCQVLMYFQYRCAGCDAWILNILIFLRFLLSQHGVHFYARQRGSVHLAGVIITTEQSSGNFIIPDPFIKNKKAVCAPGDQDYFRSAL